MNEWDPALARYSRRFIGTEAIELGERVSVELFHPQTKANLRAWCRAGGHAQVVTVMPVDDRPGQIGMKL